MGVLTDLLVASDDDLAVLAENGEGETPFDAFPGIYTQNLTAEIQVLCKVVMQANLEDVIGVLDSHVVYERDEGCFLITRLPVEFVQTLANLSENDRALLVKVCIDHEAEAFSEWDSVTLREFIDQLCVLAQTALSRSGYSVFQRVLC